MYRPKLQNVADLGQVTLLLITLFRPIHGLLLYPASTVLQLTSSISIPADLNTRTKVFMDMGFQMNYNLPATVSAFYNATIWADELSRRQKRQLDNSLDANLQQLDLEGGMHPGDFTAGQLYRGIENMLETYGFHRSCLLRSVCELALHPFAEDHFYGMVTQVVTFLLTPSQHEGFAEDEQHYRDRYEEAERIGFLGGQCHVSYPSCEADIINLATRLVR
ncbi:uncharacterized protein LOC6538725 [Drosophila yakuba]|uniref:Uncharacterized protein n=1 Tax=Drosophila yakuba TaxID=7245 RepID=B4PVV3_DROYA|nr:uncharacterized protein LOC6538725 [Drosophila yakuba]EDW98952.1 uncharacterized protein Dyak_GE23479 [Drosophila yakuba]